MSNLEEETQRVISALSTIYSISSAATTTTNREHANHYLTQYQRNPIAWQISDRLLSTAAATSATNAAATATATVQTQIYFFAAQTIHTKCRSDMLQLPSNTWTNLRDSLMNHLLRFCEMRNGNLGGVGGVGVAASSYKPIVSRLAMALCALSVQMQWFDVVDQLLLKNGAESITSAITSGNGNDANLNLILEMAQLLPEEATSYRLLIENSNIREGFIHGLVDKSPQVFQFYYTIISTISESERGNTTTTNNNNNSQTMLKIKEQVLKCIHAWVRYIHVPSNLLQTTPLIEWVFSIFNTHDFNSDVDEGDMFELAADVVIEILRCYPSDFPANTGLVQRMIPLVMALAQQPPPGAGAGAGLVVQSSNTGMTPFQKALQNEDEDGMRAYCRIFTEMGESYMSLIMHHEDLNQVALVELVLNCSALPDREIATITLHFWYRFVSWLEDLQPYEFRQFQIDNFTPQIIKLVSTCASLLQYPTDIETSLQDRIDDIQRVRFSVCDTLEDCCRLLGGDLVLQNIGKKLQEEINRLSTLPPQERLLQWHGIESCLLALNGASRYIPSDESQVLPFVMGLLPDLPTTVSHLRTTANHVVGGYATWLASHPDYLQPLLPFLAQGLSEPKCASSAALAIKRLCQSCSSSFSLGDSVLQLYDGILQAQQEQNNSMLDIKDELEVLEGACIAVSRQLDDMVKKASPQELQELAETVPKYVGRIVTPIGSKLMQFAEPNNTAGPKQVMAEFERLTVVIRFLKVPDPSTGTLGATSIAARAKLIVDLMTQCWTMLDTLSQKYITDINLAEKLCRLHKHCIRGCGANLYKPLLEKLCNQLINNFSKSHLSPYLYCASICISEYGSDPSYEQFLFGTFEAMSNATFGVLRTQDNFRDHPDVVEELLFLAVRMVNSCPRPFISNALFHAFLQCATIGMKQDHRDVNRGTLNFLEVSFSFGINLQKGASSNDPVASACKESLENAVAAEGQQIVTNSILSLLGELPCYRVACNQGSIAGILYQLHCLCPALLMEWIKIPLGSVPEGAKSMLTNAFTPNTPRNEFFEKIEHLANVCDQNQKMGR